MKNLILVLFFIFSHFLNSQTKVSYSPKSIQEDKDLSGYILNYFNEFRDSIGHKPYIKSEFWYKSSKKWNDYLANNNMWGHYDKKIMNGMEGIELIVAVPIYSEKENNYEFIAKNALDQFLNSKYHRDFFLKRRGEFPGDSEKIGFGNLEMSALLCKYIGVSVNILDLEKYKLVYIVIQGGSYDNKYGMN